MAGSLDDYRRKRDFARTPEPAPEIVDDARGATFVVHRHEARRLHYDLRLSMNGVLKSWAVPKGFSYDPSDKHLAVRTEDHPIEYETFEGMIPKGEYGAGTMTIWDRGSYRVLAEGDPAAAVESGKVEIVFRGRRLRGEWHLVRTKENWLLFKARDLYAKAEDLPPISMDLSAATPAPLVRWPEPMEPAGERAPFSDPGWLFEMELAGVRVWAHKQGAEVEIAEQGEGGGEGKGRGKDRGNGESSAGAGEGEGGGAIGERLPHLMRALAGIRAESALVDGVLVALDARGRPSREVLAQVLAGAASTPVQLYAFDLLHFDGFDLRALPLLDRKGVLAAVLARGGAVLFADHVIGNGEELVRSVAAAGLPGVVGRRAASAYVAGPSDDWCRIAAASEGAAHELDVATALEKSARDRPRRAFRVQLSNLDKVYWPKTGYTKGDLLLYYQQVAEHLLPHLQGRPLHLYRWPDGVEGKSFYQQNAPEGCPDWVHTEVIQRRHKEEPVRHIVCDDRDTLLYLINLGSIDIHPWMSRLGSLESPDWAVIDLDPKGAPFSDVVKIARETGKLLRGIGLRPLLKTSGASGLHVYIPLARGYTYDQARMFCEGAARWIVKEHGDIATVERSVGQRGGRVYVDFMQNRRGQTVVPPYAVRPVAPATVSMPLDWDELTGDLHPSLFDLRTAPARVQQRGDLFRPVLEDRQDLLPAIAALQSWVRG